MKTEKSSSKEKILFNILNFFPSKFIEVFIDRMYLSEELYPTALCYHGFLTEESDNPYTVSVENFEKQVQYLIKAGYTFLWENEYKKTNKKSVIISIDDGLKDNYYNLFPIVKKYNIKVSINLIMGEIRDDDSSEEYMSLSQIKEMQKSGLVDFESHTMSHLYLTKLNTEKLKYEFAESKKMLKEMLNIDSTVCVCPKEDANSDVIKELSEYYSVSYNYANYKEHLLSIHRVYIDDTISVHNMASKILMDVYNKKKKNI